MRRSVLGIVGAVLLGVCLVPASAAAAAEEGPHQNMPAEAEEPAAASGAGHGGHGGGPTEQLTHLLGWREDLALWTLVVFLVLLAVLYKFAWGPICQALEARERRIAEQLESAQRINDEARNLLVQYQERLNQAQAEVRAILDEARRDAQHTQQEILARARQDAEAELARARREIEIATAAALEELGRASADLAIELAGKILRAQLSPADHARLIEEALRSFPNRVPSRN
ncbi:MAG: F0F1 ATP synthase subunit B [Pirellulales bacterium]|nr:F0F1 ATP synthase subunit B [Pirellulales bacterium]